jgi:hypothetical protein
MCEGYEHFSISGGMYIIHAWGRASCKPLQGVMFFQSGDGGVDGQVTAITKPGCQGHMGGWSRGKCVE